MAPDELAIELAKLTKHVAWIDEQRQQDKDQIARLAQQVERLAIELRESVGQAAALREELRQSQAEVARVTAVEAGVRHFREQLVDVQRQAQEVEHRDSRNTTLMQSEIGRIAKVVAELSGQLDELHRHEEAHRNRVQLLAEEAKHDRAAVAPLPSLIERAEKQWLAITGRMQLVEEQLKRADGQIAALAQTDEDLRGEQKGLFQWQQSAELRWARQLADWQLQMEQWQRLLDDQGKLFNEMVRDAALGKESLDAAHRALAEQQGHIESHLKLILRLESLQEVARQEVQRLQQGIEAQRRRIDEISGGQRVVEEGLHQQVAESAALSRRIDGERSRVDELTAALRQREAEQRGERGDLEILQQELRSVRLDTQDRLAGHAEDVAALRRRQIEWLSELIALQEQHRLRQIDELERQLRELREQGETMGSADGTATVR